MDEQQEGRVIIPLDGSYGAGPDSELVIVTKAEDGRQREVTYNVPYLAVATERIQRLCDMNLILGYRIVKSSQAPGLKELGL